MKHTLWKFFFVSRIFSESEIFLTLPLGLLLLFQSNLNLLGIIRSVVLELEIILPNAKFKHGHKKQKDSLEGSLGRALFMAELEFLKILVPRLPYHTSNVNTECAGES